MLFPDGARSRRDVTIYCHDPVRKDGFRTGDWIPMQAMLVNLLAGQESESGLRLGLSLPDHFLDHFLIGFKEVADVQALRAIARPVLGVELRRAITIIPCDPDDHGLIDFTEDYDNNADGLYFVLSSIRVMKDIGWLDVPLKLVNIWCPWFSELTDEQESLILDVAKDVVDMRIIEGGDINDDEGAALGMFTELRRLHLWLNVKSCRPGCIPSSISAQFRTMLKLVEVDLRFTVDGIVKKMGVNSARRSAACPPSSVFVSSGAHSHQPLLRGGRRTSMNGAGRSPWGSGNLHRCGSST